MSLPTGTDNDWIREFMEVTGTSDAEAIEFLTEAGALGPHGDVSMEELINQFMDARAAGAIPAIPEQVGDVIGEAGDIVQANRQLPAIDRLRNFQVEADLQEQAIAPLSRPEVPVPALARDPGTGSSINRFEDLFRSPLDLIFGGDWAQAREIATAETRWLLVEIQNRTIFNSLITSRDLWPNTAIRTLVQENFLFTQYEASTPDAANVALLYQVDLELLPYIALIDPRTGENLHHWGGTGEPIDALRFASFLRGFIEVNGNVTDFDPPLEVPDRLFQQFYEIEGDIQLAIQASVSHQPGPQ